MKSRNSGRLGWRGGGKGGKFKGGGRARGGRANGNVRFQVARRKPNPDWRCLIQVHGDEEGFLKKKLFKRC